MLPFIQKKEKYLEIIAKSRELDIDLKNFLYSISNFQSRMLAHQNDFKEFTSLVSCIALCD
jgi:hypothetical protein